MFQWVLFQHREGYTLKKAHVSLAPRRVYVGNTIRLDERTESVEEPPVAVEFLLVLLLEAEEKLNRSRHEGKLARLCDHDMGGVSEHNKL